MAAHSGVLTSVLTLTRGTKWRPSAADLALLSVATHELSRIVTKDFVTAPLRAPFTRREKGEGAGEVQDVPAGGGLRASIGFLVTCPYCAGLWVATALGALHALRPEPTRFVLRLLGALAGADFLHLAYSRLNEDRKATMAERKRAENRAARQRS